MTVDELVKYIGMYNPMNGSPIVEVLYEIQVHHVTLYFLVDHTNFRLTFYESELRNYSKGYIKSLFDDICEKMRSGELVDYNANNS